MRRILGIQTRPAGCHLRRGTSSYAMQTRRTEAAYRLQAATPVSQQEARRTAGPEAERQVQARWMADGEKADKPGQSLPEAWPPAMRAGVATQNGDRELRLEGRQEAMTPTQAATPWATPMPCAPS